MSRVKELENPQKSSMRLYRIYPAKTTSHTSPKAACELCGEPGFQRQRHQARVVPLVSDAGEAFSMPLSVAAISKGALTRLATRASPEGSYGQRWTPARARKLLAALDSGRAVAVARRASKNSVSGEEPPLRARGHPRAKFQRFCCSGHAIESLNREAAQVLQSSSYQPPASEHS